MPGMQGRSPHHEFTLGNQLWLRGASDFEQDRARGQPRGSLNGECVELHLRFVLRFGSSCLVIDDSPGLAVRPREVDHAFHDFAARKNYGDWVLAVDLDGSRRPELARRP